jgi:hypothetical protein
LSIDQYKVLDLIEDVSKLKVLLVLESPHINEYIHNHPAAGKSADELTKFFTSQGYLSGFDNELPLGCNIKTQKYKSLGIMNCSNLPMNKAFYPCTIAGDDLLLVNNLMDIRSHLGKSIQGQAVDKDLIEDDIFNDFSRRLISTIKDAETNDLIIVPCGYVATNFVNRFKESYDKELVVLDGFPHPTDENWHEKINNLTLSDFISKDMLP